MNLFGIPIPFMFLWAFFGVAIGILIHLMDLDSVRGGIWGTIIMGCVGAVLGGVAASFLFHFPLPTATLANMVITVLSAGLVVTLSRLIFREHDHFKTMTYLR